MMRLLRKGDRYALNNPHQKDSDPSFYGLKCLLLSFSTYCYQFSCNAQESRASGTNRTKRDDNIKRPMAYGLQLINLFCVLLTFASVVEVQAQLPRQGGATGQAAIKPLEIGDTIPEELWHLPLQVVNHPEGKDIITLNDYRHKKLIIVDLWSTWCGTCIFTLPRTFETISKFHDDIALIPITDQSSDILVPFIRKQKQINSIPNFYSVVNNKRYMKIFDVKWLPRAIVIDNTGVIISITQPKFLTAESLKKQLNDGKAHFPYVAYRIDWYQKKHVNTRKDNKARRIAG